MKNFIILASLILLPSSMFAASQAAISQRGTCHVFKGENMVPGGWKVVDSCDNYKSQTSGKRLDAVNNRRFSSYNWHKRYSKPEAEERTHALRMGSGKLTRGGADRDAAGITDKRALRTTTTRSIGTTKSHLLQDSRRLKKSKTEWQRRRSARSGVSSGSGTQMERSGELSNKFWSTESDRRNIRLASQNSGSNIKNALARRQYLAKRGRVEKKKRVYSGPTLRRTYRGERLDGVLGN